MGVPVLGGGSLLTQGASFFVNPRLGGDGNSGIRIDRPLDTLSKALSMATADQNDVVYMLASDNSASGTTDYQSDTLEWDKDGVHLVGINSGNMVGMRSRIAQLSTATEVAPLVTWSASNCLCSNIHLFHGVDDADSKGCLNVTGSRNRFYRCHIAGIGHATMDTANNYSLQISGGEENLFEDCVIGLDTIARGTAANSELRLVSGATRNIFRNCLFTTYAEAAGHQFVLVPVNGIDRYTLFDNCLFINMPTGVASGTSMTEVFDVTGGGSPDGLLLLKDCAFVGAGDWEAATESGKVFVYGAASESNAITSGQAMAVDAS